MKTLTPNSCGHKNVPLNHFPSYKIILESVDTLVYPQTNLYTTLYLMYVSIIYIYIYLYLYLYIYIFFYIYIYLYIYIYIYIYIFIGWSSEMWSHP